MKVRLLASVCCLAAISTLLEGCAGGATRPDSPAAPVAAAQMDISNLPQMMLSGASTAEVKALAMGAARSKGWIMSQSTPDRLIVQRPLDASTLAGLPSNVPVSPGTLMEVTSFFIDQSGGVNVATKAELVSQMPGQPAPTRIDYTDNFHEPLTQSLVSLRDAWSQHRGRLARAAPPEGGWKDPWSDDKGMTSTTTDGDAANQMTAEIDTDSAQQPALIAQTPPVPLAVSPPQPVQRAPEPARPAPEPRRLSSGGAPVVDASSSRSQTTPASRASQTSMMALPAVRAPAAKPAAPASAVKVSTAKPPAAPATVAKTPATKSAATAAAKAPAAKPSAPAAKTQTAKTPAAKASTAPATVAKAPAAKTAAAKPATAATPAAKKANWSAAAEKYARQKGCKVSGKGTQLIESRKDGEVHKISCTGTDSVLVKCQNGTCKGLL
ncbi:hypothetical protein EDC35_101181 [Thiobaca trueperi]|uniref:PASTA domain-containing protein n=2 Tax=Thiobaca trueperi TaxID=127458 RepID=A0A4R3N5Y3_9GAMM|nr:hypothetical protein EDC35_101181 [Thiobaca trueperi]